MAERGRERQRESERERVAERGSERHLAGVPVTQEKPCGVAGLESCVLCVRAVCACCVCVCVCVRQCVCAKLRWSHNPVSTLFLSSPLLSSPLFSFPLLSSRLLSSPLPFFYFCYPALGCVKLCKCYVLDLSAHVCGYVYCNEAMHV